MFGLGGATRIYLAAGATVSRLGFRWRRKISAAARNPLINRAGDVSLILRPRLIGATYISDGFHRARRSPDASGPRRRLRCWTCRRVLSPKGHGQQDCQRHEMLHEEFGCLISNPSQTALPVLDFGRVPGTASIHRLPLNSFDQIRFHCGVLQCGNQFPPQVVCIRFSQPGGCFADRRSSVPVRSHQRTSVANSFTSARVLPTRENHDKNRGARSPMLLSIGIRPCRHCV
jgi:hypothetical protein